MNYAWEAYGRNLRGVRVMVNWNGVRLRGTVITHVRDNRWLVLVHQMDQRVVLGRKEFTLRKAGR